MKISELTHSQLRVLVNEQPKWVAEHFADHFPGVMLRYPTQDVPEGILAVLSTID